MKIKDLKKTKKQKKKEKKKSKELIFKEMEARCECGQQRVMRTSWTNLNPGRSFWACEDRLCNRSFEWAENPLSEKARRIVRKIPFLEHKGQTF